MQSFFRLPWSTDTACDKALLDTVVYPKARQHKPIVEIPAVNKQKRKRTSSVESSPRSAPQPKKLKPATNGGAVQPSLQPARGPDMHSITAPNLINGLVQMDKSTETDGNGRAPGDNSPSNGIASGVDQQLPREKSQSSHDSVNKQQTPNAQDAPASTSHKTTHSAEMLPKAIVNDSIDMSVDSNLDHVRSIIGAQFDLEILLKHNELRLIEQELAKCQVALEQIRRCELLPYPGNQGISSDVASGIGPALKPADGFTVPKQPAPFGVTDGPYTRHYSQWLIQDQVFDSQPVQAGANASASTPLYDRATRRNGGEVLVPGMPSARSSRSSGGVRADFGAREAPQPYKDPLVIKRLADGQMVRLVCTKCQPERSNFQNVQGFLNHCRISHKDYYETHEAAAIACGRVVDVDDSYTAPHAAQPRKSVPASFSDPSHSRTPVSAAQIIFERPTINKLIKETPTEAGVEVRRSLVIPRPFNPNGTASGTATPIVASLSTLISSPQTPHLSQLLRKRGIAGDLEAAVTQAKQKVDTSAYNVSDSESELPPNPKNKKQKKSGQPKHPKSSASTHKAGLSTQHHHPKHPTVAGQHPFPPQARRPNMTLASVPHPTMGPRTEIPDSPTIHDEMDLSPGTAADSNPGLVSDHDDDDDDADEDAMVVDHPTAPPHGTLGAPGLGVPPGPNRGCRGSLVEIDGFAVEIEDSDGEGGREGAKRVRVGAGVGGNAC